MPIGLYGSSSGALDGSGGTGSSSLKVYSYGVTNDGNATDYNITALAYLPNEVARDQTGDRESVENVFLAALFNRNNNNIVLIASYATINSGSWNINNTNTITGNTSASTVNFLNRATIPVITNAGYAATVPTTLGFFKNLTVTAPANNVLGISFDIEYFLERYNNFPVNDAAGNALTTTSFTATKKPISKIKGVNPFAVNRQYGSAAFNSDIYRTTGNTLVVLITPPALSSTQTYLTSSDNGKTFTTQSFVSPLALTKIIYSQELSKFYCLLGGTARASQDLITIDDDGTNPTFKINFFTVFVNWVDLTSKFSLVHNVVTYFLSSQGFVNLSVGGANGVVVTSLTNSPEYGNWAGFAKLIPNSEIGVLAPYCDSAAPNGNFQLAIAYADSSQSVLNWQYFNFGDIVSAGITVRIIVAHQHASLFYSFLIFATSDNRLYIFNIINSTWVRVKTPGTFVCNYITEIDGIIIFHAGLASSEVARSFYLDIFNIDIIDNNVADYSLIKATDFQLFEANPVQQNVFAFSTLDGLFFTGSNSPVQGNKLYLIKNLKPLIGTTKDLYVPRNRNLTSTAAGFFPAGFNFSGTTIVGSIQNAYNSAEVVEDTTIAFSDKGDIRKFNFTDGWQTYSNQTSYAWVDGAVLNSTFLKTNVLIGKDAFNNPTLGFTDLVTTTYKTFPASIGNFTSIAVSDDGLKFLIGTDNGTLIIGRVAATGQIAYGKTNRITASRINKVIYAAGRFTACDTNGSIIYSDPI